MKSKTAKKVLLTLIFLFTFLNAQAGIDWSKHDGGPTFFLGWETTFYFAIATLILFGLSWLLSENKTDNEEAGCLIGILNTAAIICAICSYYLIIPLFILYTIIQALTKKK